MNDTVPRRVRPLCAPRWRSAPFPPARDSLRGWPTAPVLNLYCYRFPAYAGEDSYSVSQQSPIASRETTTSHRRSQIVELGGLEPPTSSMPLRCAPNCATAPSGLTAQPRPPHRCHDRGPTGQRFAPVELGGFEPPTSSVRLMRAPSCATAPVRIEYTPKGRDCQVLGSRVYSLPHTCVQEDET